MCQNFPNIFFMYNFRFSFSHSSNTHILIIIITIHSYNNGNLLFLFNLLMQAKGEIIDMLILLSYMHEIQYNLSVMTMLLLKICNSTTLVTLL